MIQGCVTLDEVFSAAAVRAASLVPETSGYLALAVGDATSRLPFAVDDRMVMLTTEGNVAITRRGEVLPPKQAASCFRDLLARLLAVSTGTAMPALASAGRPREESDRGVEAVVGEIEAALIPVNRAAARRALARLARETIKAKEAGKVKPRPSNRPPAAPAEAPKAAVEAPKPVVEAPKPVPVASASSDHTVAPQLVAEATTPPPVDAAPRVIAPPVAAATPLPAVTMRTAPVVILPTPPPLPVEAEPTPTVLGMGAIEVEVEIEVPTEVDAVVAPRTPTPAAAIETSEATIEASGAGIGEIDSAIEGSGPGIGEIDSAIEGSGPGICEIDSAIEGSGPGICEIDSVIEGSGPGIETNPVSAEAVGEPVVLAQPTESPTTAFELTGRAARPVMDALTPAFALDTEVALRALPAARVLLADPRLSPLPPQYGPHVHTRADDLLARFGAAQMDDRAVREAAAYLRRIAGLEGTPPPAPVEARPTPPPAPVEPAVVAPARAEEPEPPVASAPVRARRGRSLPSLGVTLAVLLLGLAGGGALVRYRPDLFGVTRAVSPPPAQPAPAVTADPRGAQAPAWAPSNAARAERGGSERAR